MSAGRGRQDQRVSGLHRRCRAVGGVKRLQSVCQASAKRCACRQPGRRGRVEVRERRAAWRCDAQEQPPRDWLRQHETPRLATRPGRARPQRDQKARRQRMNHSQREPAAHVQGAVQALEIHASPGGAQPDPGIVKHPALQGHRANFTRCDLCLVFSASNQTIWNLTTLPEQAS